MKNRKAKYEYIEYLNEIGAPEEDKRENGGRVPGFAKYGNWLKKHDPIAFYTGYNEWSRRE